MNREIKFRAWNIQQRRMLNNFYGLVNQLGYDGICVLTKDVKSYCPDPHLYPPDENIIMQYTGLKDKNGKDIYEGDIVNGGMFNGVYCYGKIIFDGGHFYAVSIFPRTEGTSTDFNFFEVIGNIYENPELINH